MNGEQSIRQDKDGDKEREKNLPGFKKRREKEKNWKRFTRLPSTVYPIYETLINLFQKWLHQFFMGGRGRFERKFNGAMRLVGSYSRRVG